MEPVADGGQNGLKARGLPGQIAGAALQRLGQGLRGRDVDARADIPAELPLGVQQRHPMIQKPAILAIMAA